MSTERQLTVPLHTLLSRLAEIGVRIEEYDLVNPPRKLYNLGCKLPSFPFGEREHTWYPLLVNPDQIEIDREKADSILRHVWHSARPFFEDELEAELIPNGEHEEEIAARVDAKARAVRDGHEHWGNSTLEDLKASLSFELSESEIDYLEVRLEWRRDTPISG